METGLGQLGFWLAVGMVVAAMIVSAAIKARDRERDRQAALRADLDRKQAARQALLDNAGGNIAEVLAYLRERDAAAAAKGAEAAAEMRKGKMSERQGLTIAAAFVVAGFTFMGGIFALVSQDHRPAFPRFVMSPDTHRMVLQPPPPPVTGWAAFAPVGVMLAIWVVGLSIAGLIGWLAFKQKNDARPDA